MSDQQPHLFTYGSLMFAPVWSQLVCGHYKAINARLNGYQRICIHGEDYPALIPGRPDEHVDGIIYLHIQPGDMQRLDAFEGEEYERRSVICLADQSGELRAETYLYRPSLTHRLHTRAWDPHRFQTQDMQRFLDEYGGFHSSTHRMAP